MSESKPLKLRAEAAEDLAVISGLLQDAIANVGDMDFDATQRQFRLSVSRFRWENKQETPCERIQCAIFIDGIANVKALQIDFKRRSEPLDLLALTSCPEGLMVTFAGGAALKFMAPGWKVKIEDFGQPWPAGCRPCHDEPAIDVTRLPHDGGANI